MYTLRRTEGQQPSRRPATVAPECSGARTERLGVYSARRALRSAHIAAGRLPAAAYQITARQASAARPPSSRLSVDATPRCRCSDRRQRDDGQVSDGRTTRPAARARMLNAFTGVVVDHVQLSCCSSSPLLQAVRKLTGGRPGPGLYMGRVTLAKPDMRAIRLTRRRLVAKTAVKPTGAAACRNIGSVRRDQLQDYCGRYAVKAAPLTARSSSRTSMRRWPCRCNTCRHASARADPAGRALAR